MSILKLQWFGDLYAKETKNQIGLSVHFKKYIDSNNNIDSVSVKLVPPLSDEPAAAHATKEKWYNNWY